MTTFPVGDYGCNCSILWDHHHLEAIVIDPGNDPDPVLNFVAQHDLKVRFLLHTHAHFDHIGHSSTISQKLNAPVYLHNGDKELYENLALQGQFFQQKVGPTLTIDNWLEDEQQFSISTASSIVSTLYTPGHTPGSCCFYTQFFDTPVLFSGDTLFNRSIGRTDLPGGDSHLITQSIKKRLYTLPDETVVITGHGPSTHIASEKKHNLFVR